MRVVFMSCTPDLETNIAIAARICYSNKTLEQIKIEMLDDENKRNAIERIISSGHQSPLEHGSFTFYIENVSRALLAQITRHRIASFSVRSQRYCDMSKDSLDNYYHPKTSPDNVINELDVAYNEELDHYKKLIELGCKKEIARMVLPNGAPTNLVMTMNCREIYHFCGLRCCNRAQAEIRAVANEIMKICYHEAPIVFSKLGPHCTQLGYCPEGKMSCGMYPSLEDLKDKAFESDPSLKNKYMSAFAKGY